MKQIYKDYSNYTHDEREYLTGLQGPADTGISNSLIIT